MKTCFLLGSGISRPAGLPSVDEITKQVLSPKDFVCCSDGIFRRDETVQAGTILSQSATLGNESIEQLLRWLKGLGELRYAADTLRSVNYEDLAYLAAQIHDDSLGEYENPALGPLICWAVNSFPHLRPGGEAAPDKLGSMAGQTVNYIADVVAEMLAKEPGQPQLKHLQLFHDAVADLRFDKMSLFTLNHDNVLERFLRTAGVRVVDGFDSENSLGIRCWNPSLFDCQWSLADKPGVRLFKLHGSIDWRRFRPKEKKNESSPNPWREEYVGIRREGALPQVEDKQGRIHEPFDRALFLAGTFNKMLSYVNHIFLELHYRFYRTLADSSWLVVCGYGFGDKGINNRIADWMSLFTDHAKRRMILIEPRSLEKVREMSRGAIASKLPLWKEEKCLIHLQFRLGDLGLTWEKVSNKLLEK